MFLVAVFSDECVTLMTSLLIRMGSKVIKEGVWTNQQPESRAKPLSVPHLCPGSQRQGFAWNPCHHCHGDPVSLLLPLQEMVLSDLGSSGASQAVGQGHKLWSPCS